MSRPKIVTYRAHGRDVDGLYGLLRWRVKSANGEDIAKISEGYHREADRVRSIQITYEACKDWLEQHDREYFQKPVNNLTDWSGDT